TKGMRKLARYRTKVTLRKEPKATKGKAEPPPPNRFPRRAVRLFLLSKTLGKRKSESSFSRAAMDLICFWAPTKLFITCLRGDADRGTKRKRRVHPAECFP